MPAQGRIWDCRPRWLIAAAALAAALSAAGAAQAAPQAKHPRVAAQPAAGPPTVFASGLTNPRGLTFGPDGALYVAEGGAGGTRSSVDVCPDEQVPSPIGPYHGGNTGLIERFAADGSRMVVASGLPSSTAGPGFTSGVADVKFLDGQLYGLLAGGGCSHGNPGTSNTIFRVNLGGSTTDIANLSAFIKANPVKNPEPDDFEPDGTWYSMAVSGGAFYAVEPNHGEVDKVTLDGTITRVIDVSAKLGHVVPTSIAAWNGRFYLGNLGTFPVTPGSEFLRKLTPGGKLGLVASGLTTVQGLVVDKHGRIYVLESMTAPGFPGPAEIGTGMVVQIKSDGSQVPIATGLSFASGMTLGPDHALYVSNFGFGGPPGAGQILRIALR